MAKFFIDRPVFAMVIAIVIVILGSVAIPKRNQDTFGRDVEEMISRKQTFDEAVESDGTMIMTKQRLRVIQRELFRQLDAIPIV